MAEGMPVEDDRFTTQTSHSYRTTLFTHWQKQTLRPQQSNQLLDRQENRSPECTNITSPVVRVCVIIAVSQHRSAKFKPRVGIHSDSGSLHRYPLTRR